MHERNLPRGPVVIGKWMMTRLDYPNANQYLVRSHMHSATEAQICWAHAHAHAAMPMNPQVQTKTLLTNAEDAKLKD